MLEKAYALAHQAALGQLSPAISSFLKVTESYWPGLFQYYDVDDRPAPIMNWSNALAQYATQNGVLRDDVARLQGWWYADPCGS